MYLTFIQLNMSTQSTYTFDAKEVKVYQNKALDIIKRCAQENALDELQTFIEKNILLTKEEIIDGIKGKLITDVTSVSKISKGCLKLLYSYGAITWEENEYVYIHYNNLWSNNPIYCPSHIVADICKYIYDLRQTQPHRFDQVATKDYIAEFMRFKNKTK